MVQVSCHKCAQTFTTKRLFVSHLITKSCHKSIREAAKSQTRNKTVQEDVLDYPTLEIVPVQDCPVCRRFSKAGLQMYMLGHLATHVQDSAEYYQCSVCGLKFESGYYLEKHENKKHRNERCSDCPKKFKLLSLLQKHVEDVHNTEKCVECDFRTANTNDLESHIYIKHPKDICDECGMAFEDELALDEHFKEIHVKMICDDCDEEFDSDDMLEDHRVNVHKHNKTTFKEFGGGLMMMMITETQEPSEEELDVKKKENFGSTENPMDCEEVQEEATDTGDSSSEETRTAVVSMDAPEQSEGIENKNEIEADTRLLENENINVFGTGFFMMYSEESDGNKSDDEKDAVSAVVENGNMNSSSGDEATINSEIGKESLIQEVIDGDACNTSIEEPLVDDLKGCSGNTKEYDEKYSPEL